MKIPKEHASALRTLATLSEISYERLREALQASRRTFHPDHLAEDLVKSVSDVSPADLTAMVALLVSMYSALDYTDTPSEDFAEAVSEAAIKHKLDGVELSAESGRALGERLSALLTTDAISFRSKAISVLREQNHAFCSARVLTDVRPVFDSNLESPPQSAFLIHTLRVSYHKGSDIEEFYVALDKDDLMALSEVIDRAKAKDENLRGVLQNVNISALTT